MNSLSNRLIFVTVVLTVTSLSSPAQVIFKVQPEGPSQTISPYIYGINAIAQNPSTYASLDELNLGSDRLGGNRMTGYNWENNASSAGSDWQHNSDSWLTSNPLKAETGPAGALHSFFLHNLTIGRYSIVQLPMAGYVAADANGPVNENETAPSNRWKSVIFKKNSAFTLNPDLTDESVYVDECVFNLVQRHGKASQGGINAYCLDNEPGLWNSTHIRIHPVKATGQEIIDKSAELALAIKSVDETAEIIGLESWGYWEMHDFSGSIDWDHYKENYDWAISAYLGEMKKKSDAANMRLLDILGLHWYPEAKGDGKRITGQDTTAGVIEARLQAPRSLWDSTYKEDSWLMDLNGRKPLNLLPRVHKSIDTWYPETKIAITEYNYGASNHWSGALALADVLGIFAREGVFAANIHVPPTNFLADAFKLFRNLDGYYNGFGDTYVPSVNPDSINYAIYSALNSQNPKFLHMIIINKKNSDIPATIRIEGSKQYLSGIAFGLAEGDTSLVEKTAVPLIEANSFSYTLPKHSMLHFILSTESKTVLPQPVFYTLTTTEIGQGTINRSDEKKLIAQGTEVTLTAIPAQGWSFAGWSGDTISSNESITVKMSRNLDIKALFMSSQELVVNGTFENGKTGWTFSTWSQDNSAKGNAVVESGVLKYSVENGGPETWNVQFFQRNLPLVQGTQYTLCFDAWSSDNDSANIFIGNNGGYGGVPRNIKLTPTKQSFKIDFTMDSASDPSARLSFDLGGLNRQGIYFFDNISLKARNSSIPVINSFLKSARLEFCMINNNACELFLEEDSKVTINIFDLKGRMIKPIVDKNLFIGSHRFPLPHTLGSGTYLLRVKAGSKSTVLRFKSTM